jgi:hypothetical protein
MALYPDPLLGRILAAAIYPDQISDAARWADQHHYLTGQALAHAISAINCHGTRARAVYQ